MAPGAVSTRVILCHDLLRHSPRLQICPLPNLKLVSNYNYKKFQLLTTITNTQTKFQLNYNEKFLTSLSHTLLPLPLILPCVFPSKRLPPLGPNFPHPIGGRGLRLSRCRSVLAPAMMSMAQSPHVRGGFTHFTVAPASSVPSGMKF